MDKEEDLKSIDLGIDRILSGSDKYSVYERETRNFQELQELQA